MGVLIKIVRREQVVNGVTYRVPSHVIRVEGVRVKGWQVRFSNPKSSKLFSDGVHGSTRKAFVAACHFALANRPQINTQAKPPTQKHVPGVAVLHEVREGKTPQIHILVRALYRGGKSRKFYVGTENTWTAEREAQKMQEALVWRSQLVKERDTQLKAERCKSEQKF